MSMPGGAGLGGARCPCVAGGPGLQRGPSRNVSPTCCLLHPEFMAPEVYGQSYDEKVDIYR